MFGVWFGDCVGCCVFMILLFGWLVWECLTNAACGLRVALLVLIVLLCYYVVLWLVILIWCDLWWVLWLVCCLAGAVNSVVLVCFFV